MERVKTGDYVLATKYQDGDPRDHWAVGYYHGLTEKRFPEVDPSVLRNRPRYDVIDSDGNLLRNNGFRRVKRIDPAVGQWLLDNASDIESSGKSLWCFVAMIRQHRLSGSR